MDISGKSSHSLQSWCHGCGSSLLFGIKPRVVFKILPSFTQIGCSTLSLFHSFMSWQVGTFCLHLKWSSGTFILLWMMQVCCLILWIWWGSSTMWTQCWRNTVLKDVMSVYRINISLPINIIFFFHLVNFTLPVALVFAMLHCLEIVMPHEHKCIHWKRH